MLHYWTFGPMDDSIQHCKLGETTSNIRSVFAGVCTCVCVCVYAACTGAGASSVVMGACDDVYPISQFPP